MLSFSAVVGILDLDYGYNSVATQITSMLGSQLVILIFLYVVSPEEFHSCLFHIKFFRTYFYRE